jgi:hypothetical protein
VSIAGVLGGLAGAGVDLLVQPESEKVAIAIPLVGSVVGLGLGVRATRRQDGAAVSASRFGSSPPPLREASAGPSGSRGGTALLTLERGRLALGTPVPVPMLVQVLAPEGTGFRRAVAVELLRASF